MLQSNVSSSAITFEEKQLAKGCKEKQEVVVAPASSTASSSLPKVWSYLDRKRKIKAAQIMTCPTILPRSDDGELVPHWAFKELETERERDALRTVVLTKKNQEDDEGEKASDLEVALYLKCASLEGPITEQACRIYFHAASRINSSLKGAMESSGIETRQLDDYDSKELVAFKKWIRKQQVGKNKNKKIKILRFIRMNDTAIIELENFDLLCAEEQV